MVIFGTAIMVIIAGTTTADTVTAFSIQAIIPTMATVGLDLVSRFDLTS